MSDINLKEYQFNPAHPFSENGKRYLAYLLAGERRTALKFINELVAEGVPLKTIYLEIFQRAQWELGFLWETNQISVAEEHYCTAATQMIMAQLYPHFLIGERKGHVAVIASVGGELHEIGARMVSDFLEMDGWDTYYIGANTPADSLIELIKNKKPDVVGLSVTMSFHIPELKALIERIYQEVEIERNALKIVVGGRPFNVAEDLWKKLGDVDGYGKNLESAVELVNQLVSEEKV